MLKLKNGELPGSPVARALNISERSIRGAIKDGKPRRSIPVKSSKSSALSHKMQYAFIVSRNAQVLYTHF